MVARCHDAMLAEPVREVLASSHAALVSAWLRAKPGCDPHQLTTLLGVGAQEFRLSGVDLMPMRSSDGSLTFRVLELNSAPGFAYCMPGLDAWTHAYVPTIRALAEGLDETDLAGLALLTESKIPVETDGFGLCLERFTGRPAWVLGPPEIEQAEQAPTDGGVRMRIGSREVRGGLRYLHAKPWMRLPPTAVGHFRNGTAIDLKGGRDKVAAHRAFAAFEAAMAPAGLRIDTPRSWIIDDAAALVEALAALVEQESWGVSKIRDGNSGFGIDFFDPSRVTDRAWPRFPFVIQEMLSPPALAPDGCPGLLGARCRGDTDNARYAFDLRAVVHHTLGGFRPLALYGRRAATPLASLRPGTVTAAALDAALKVNIAVSTGGGFRLELERLLIGDAVGWHSMGLSVDDARRAMVQAMLATAAVDRFGVAEVTPA